MSDGDLEETRISNRLGVRWETTEAEEMVETGTGRDNKERGHRGKDQSRDSELAYRPSRQGGEVQRIEEDPDSALANDGTIHTRRPSRNVRRRSSKAPQRIRGTESDGLPVVTFRAALSYSRDPISINGDGEIKVVFEVPASEMAEAVKLLLYRNKSFVVSIQENQREEE